MALKCFAVAYLLLGLRQLALCRCSCVGRRLLRRLLRGLLGLGQAQRLRRLRVGDGVRRRRLAARELLRQRRLPLQGSAREEEKEKRKWSSFRFEFSHALVPSLSC